MFTRRSMMVAVLLCLVQDGTSAPNPPATLDELSIADVHRLQSISASHPCAVLALVNLLELPAPLNDGTLYLDAIPSSADVSALLEQSDTECADRLAALLQSNPYSSAPFLLKIQWWVASASSTARTVTFHAQVVAREGGPDASQFIEPVAVVLVSESGARLLPLAQAERTKLQAATL